MIPPTSDAAPRGLRLETAVADGLVLPDGPISVFRPRAGEAFGPLPRERLQMVTGFWPDHDAFTQAGFVVAPEAGPAPIALVCLPRTKAEGLALIAQAIAKGARIVLVDGQKTDGVESVLKAVRARVAIGGTLSKAHGKLFWFATGGADFSDWELEETVIADPALGAFRTRPGVFSADGVDPGSALLAQHLPETLPARMADLGAGWGYLAAACLARAGVAHLHLVEAEASALALAKVNIQDPRTEFHWADACSLSLTQPLDGVVMNPPFHTGRKPQPALGFAFIASAARSLGPRGKLWMVANRHLPYERALAQLFTSHEILAQTPSFIVWQAAQPRRKPLTDARKHAPRTPS